MKEQEGILYLFALLHLSVNLSSDTVQTLPTYVYNISMLRKARNIGDEETVNHYVLSRLNSQKGDKFDFEIL